MGLSFWSLAEENKGTSGEPHYLVTSCRSVGCGIHLQMGHPSLNPIRVYIGCGSSPIKGWLNFDNSLTVRIARYPLLSSVLCRSELQKQFAQVVRDSNIQWANADNVPVPDHSVNVLYTCHMMEHLDQEEVQAFLREARRIIKPGGILRVVVPDIQKLVNRYLATNDANDFIEHTLLAVSKPKSFKQKLLHLFNGHRNHHWMYDSASMVALLESAGFSRPVILDPGTTTIANPGEMVLSERAGESLCVEALV